jgi:3-hydroxymyristoyl/3-hydroxydecanoyl-(acyl carrier protein) dehydratase
MAATDFRGRPVAGLAGRIDILASAHPGQSLDLAVELDRLDRDAIAYHGVAQVEGAAILQLNECVGPMLPAEEFDDPAALRDRFDVLCGSGACQGGFPGVDELPLDVVEGRGPRRRATLRVPAAAPLFADHFPRRPVLPGTLLLDAMFRLARIVARDVTPSARTAVWSPRTASDVKVRAFIGPGETLDVEATLHEQDPQRLRLRLGARVGDKSVASARVELLPEGER